MKVLVIFSILFLISIVTLSTSNVESLPVDGIIIKDSAGNQITPVLNKEIFFHYNVQNYGNQSQTYELDISANNDDTNLPIFHKKMQLILEPNESKPIVWSFTPTLHGNYSAKITKNEITLVNSFSIESYPKSEKSGMNFSEFQEFCKETEDRNRDLMPIEQRLLVNLCDRGLSEKHWNWIGSDLDWKNFVQNVANEYAQEIPLFIEKGFEDSLIVNTSISGRDSFPPPMFAYISFYYDEDNKSKRFGEKYIVNIFGEFTKAKDHRLSPLKLFNIGYHLDEIQCKENLVLVQKYDGSPACVERGTHWKLIERDWTKTDSATKSIIQKAKSLGISNTMDAIDSRELSIEEKEQYVHAKYTISHDESPTLNIRIKDLPRTLEYGEIPTFTIIETGYAEPCTSPKLQVYHLKQEIGNDHTDDDLVYEDQLVYRCPSIKEMDAILNIWDDSRFKPMPVCEEEGRFLIVGDSGYERGALESYTCIGK